MEQKPSYTELAQEIKNLRKQLAEKENEGHVRELIDSSDDFILLCSPKGIIYDCNEAFCKIINRTKKEIVGKNHLKFFNTEVENYMEKQLATVIASKQKLELIDESKSNIYHTTISPIIDENGEINRVSIYARNITEKTLTERALAESEQKLRNILENSTGMFYYHSVNHILSYVSPQVENILGYSAEESLVNWLDFATDNPINKIGYEHTQRAIDTGIAQAPFELELNHKNGQKVWVEVHESPVLKNGKTFSIVGVLTNITARKKAEHQLKEREKMFSTIFALSPNGMTLTNVKTGRFQEVNQSACEILGYKPSELLGKTSVEIKIWRDEESRSKILEKLLKKGRLINEEVQYQAKDGGIIDTKLSTAVIEINNEQVILSDIVDVTKGKKAEKLLKESEAQYRNIIESTSEGCWVMNNDRITSDVNNSLCEILGYSRDEIIGKSPLSFVDEENAKIFKSQIAKIPGTDHRQYEIFLKTKSGNSIPVLFNATTIRNSIGQTIKSFAFVTNLTRRKKTQEALKSSIQRLSLAQKAGKVGIWEWDVIADKITWSDMAYEIFGLQNEKEFMNTDRYFDFILPKDKQRIIVELEIALKNKQTAHKTEYRIKRHKQTVWIDEVSEIIYDQEGKFVRMIGTMHDITDRKNVEHALIESNKTKDKFFSIIAHDLKSPFNALLGFSDLLVSKSDNFDEATKKKFLSAMNQNIKSTYNLLENLLLWSQAQRGTIDFHPVKENLYLLVTETFNLVKQQADSKSIILKNAVVESIYILVDKNMILTVLRNLISNAIKFTTKNGTVEISYRTNVAAGGKFMNQICIKDNGLGISEEKQKQLFKISEGISSKGTEGEGGTGLGLILCKEFVEQHGGEIWVKSEAGKGSEFCFTIPEP